MPDTTDRDQLAKIITLRRGVTGKTNDNDRALADDIVNAGWRPPARIITKLKDLDELPIDAVVIDTDDEVFQKTTDPARHVGRRYSEWDTPSGQEWETDAILLPVTILYLPVLDQDGATRA